METSEVTRKMRRSECLLSAEETLRYLCEENWGVLSVHGENGFPYGVPMNYVWDNGTVLLHATSGNSHRLDSIRKDPKVCFTVVPEHRLDRKNWTTEYVSVIIFGTAEIISDPGEMFGAMKTFMGSLAPDMTAEAFRSCDPGKAKMVMIRVHPSAVTGKQNY